MAIIFDYRVKYAGKYYPPNTPIEMPDQKAPEAAETSPASQVDEEPKAKQEAVKKASRSRRKGDV